MRTYFIIAMCAMSMLLSCTPQTPTEPKSAVSTYTSEKYKLYPTKNMWTFLKLNTSTGQVWRVQFSISGDESRNEGVVSDLILDNSGINGRYELYPTENFYNFVMLDTYDGHTYQVQWSFDENNCFVLPIGINIDAIKNKE